MPDLRTYFFLLVVLFVSACNNTDKKSTSYSLFVAGHAYGKAEVNNDGLHPAFKKSFEQIDSVENMAFGVLNGDFVYTASEKDWQEVERDVALINFPVHFVMGNHEYRKPKLLNRKFERTYYSFEIQKDLHIILDGNLAGWNIKGEQLDFLKNTLSEKAGEANRIFIYVHQLIWWTPEGPYSKIRLNSDMGRDSISNFETEIKPVLQQVEKPVYVIAGDVGAANWSDNCSYHIDQNIHLISSGMGKDIGSNYLIIEVAGSDSLSLNWMAINEAEGAITINPKDYCILD